MHYYNNNSIKFCLRSKHILKQNELALFHKEEVKFLKGKGRRMSKRNCKTMWEVFKNGTDCDSSLQVCGRYTVNTWFFKTTHCWPLSLCFLWTNREQANNIKVGKDINTLISCAWTKALQRSASTLLDHFIFYNKKPHFFFHKLIISKGFVGPAKHLVSLCSPS